MGPRRRRRLGCERSDARARKHVDEYVAQRRAERETTMSKHQRGNREAKKPKQARPPPAPPGTDVLVPAIAPPPKRFTKT